MPCPRHTILVATLIAVAVTAAACGRRGDPEFVSESAPVAASRAGTLPAEPPKSTEPVKPKQSFILDGLL